MSLKLKFSIVISLIIVFIICSLGIFLVTVRSHEIERDLLARDTLITEQITPYLSSYINQYYIFQFDTYAETIKNLIHKYPDIVHFRILATDNSVIIDSSEITKGKYDGPHRILTDPRITSIIASQKVYQDFVTVNGERTIRMYVPYIDQYGGYSSMVEFNFSLGSITTAIANDIRFLSILCIFFMLLGVLLTILLVNKITKPIKLVIDGAKALSNGNLDYRINTLNSHDELGQLARVFNHMATELRLSYGSLQRKIAERTKELEQAKKQLETVNISLEDKVKERTKDLENLKMSLEKTVEDRTAELHQKLQEVERMNKVMIGRELKMIELKKQIKEATRQ